MSRVLVRLVATAMLAAAALHAGLVDEHLQEWWGYGLFFIVASIAQAIYGLVLFALPRRPSWDPAHWRAWRVRLYTAGLLGNAFVLLLYVATRTVGVPFGPNRGDVEPVSPLGLATKGFELLAVAGLAVLLRRARGESLGAPLAVA